MQSGYLEITYRHGKPLAAYIYLARRPADSAARSTEAEPGIVVDYAEDGRPIGIEITSPRALSLEALNRVLTMLKQAPLSDADLRPLAQVG